MVKNAELTKARILEAAENEFADKGIYGARVDTIAKMAMANKQLIYAYFGSKEQLYIKVLERIYERVTEISAILNTEAFVDSAIRQTVSSAETLSNISDFH